LPKSIEESTLKEILSEGLTAPSWSNTRPFVVAVASGEQRDRISDALVSRLRDSKELPGMGANPDYTHVIPYPAGLVERSPSIRHCGFL
jgi:hypothetical protein